MAWELAQRNEPSFKTRSSFVAMKSTRMVYTLHKTQEKFDAVIQAPAHKMLHK